MDGWIFHMNKIPRANNCREESLVSARRHSVSTFVDNWLGWQIFYLYSICQLNHAIYIQILRRQWCLVSTSCEIVEEVMRVGGGGSAPARDRISSKSRDHRTTNGPRAERPICHLHFWILKRLPAILQSLGTHYSCRCSIVLVLLTQNTQSTPKYPHKRTFQRKKLFWEVVKIAIAKKAWI